MATRPHLSQIQSSDPIRYAHLLEEILDINSNIDKLTELGTNAIVDTYRELEDIEDKQVGFYLVRNDETYRNNPTHYFYNGMEFKMVGGRLPEGLLKKTVVFYVKRYNEEGQSIQLHVPYKGYISNITLCNSSGGEVSFKLWNGDDLIDEFESNSTFMGWDIYYEIDNPILTMELVGEEIGLENININVDIIIED